MNQMPIFSTKDSKYLNYAAAIASCDPVRKERDNKIWNSSNIINKAYFILRPHKYNDISYVKTLKNRAIADACENYFELSKRIVRFLFNRFYT